MQRAGSRAVTSVESTKPDAVSRCLFTEAGSQCSLCPCQESSPEIGQNSAASLQQLLWFEFQQELRGRHLLQPRWSPWGRGCHPPRVLLCSAPPLHVSAWAMTSAQQAGPQSSAQAWPLPHRDTCLRLLRGFAPPGICLGTSPEPTSAWATFLSGGSGADTHFPPQCAPGRRILLGSPEPRLTPSVPGAQKSGG